MNNHRHTPRAEARVPRGAKAGPWTTRYYCHNCGFHSSDRNKIKLCAACGSTGSTGHWNEFPARFVRYGLFYKFACIMNNREIPSNYWEFRGEGLAHA